MPRGPKGEKRPADVNARAVMIAKIATGAIEEKLKAPSGKVRSGKARRCGAGQKSIARRTVRYRQEGGGWTVE
jgi:hypothetical protein